MDKNTKIRISYIEPGSVLKSRGSYTSAEIKVTNSFKYDEKTIILEQSKTLKEPEYLHSKKTVILEDPFVQHWLERKSWRPNSSLRSARDRMMYSIFKDWKQVSPENILKAAAKLYLIDIGIDYKEADIDLL